MPGLVGDIGGTNARFALMDADGRLSTPKAYRDADYPSAEAAIEAYLGEAGAAQRPDSVVLAVAGPVENGEAAFTNIAWKLSEARLRRDGGFVRARLINDFAAQALGAVRLPPSSLRPLGPPVEVPSEGTIAVLGPGTGFGVSGLVREGGRETVIATEGGHVGFAPTDDLEVEIWRRFAARHGRVSVERVLSGPGLFELYQVLADIEGADTPCTDERAVQAAAERGDDLAAATTDRFCRILGSTAGDIALTLGARGGVYVTGGVAERLAGPLAAGGFRERFEAKGRFRGYMAAIPTFLITDPYVALIGGAQALRTLEPA